MKTSLTDYAKTEQVRPRRPCPVCALDEELRIEVEANERSPYPVPRRQMVRWLNEEIAPEQVSREATERHRYECLGLSRGTA